MAFTWATDTNYTNGPDAGSPTKDAPSPGVRAEGFVPQTLGAPQRINALFNEIGEDLSDLQDQITYPTPIARTSLVPASNAVSHTDTSDGTSLWNRISGAFVARFTGSLLEWYLPLPTGAVVTQVRAIVKPLVARAAGSRMTCTLRSTSSSGSTSVRAAVQDDGT